MAEQNIDYEVVKKPGQDTPLTEWEVEDFLRCRDDPWFFFTQRCKVIGPKGVDYFEPRDYQIELLQDVIDNRFVIANAPRQTGKTTLAALWALHQITFFSDITVGLTSFKLVNCRDLISRIKDAYSYLPDYLKNPVITWNTSEIKFTNGSTAFAQVLSGNTFRGRTITGTAIIDEYSYCPPAVAEEFYVSFMPALEAAGEDSTTKVLIISTPQGTTGKYAELAFGAMNKNNGWVYHKVDHKKIPGRTEKFKKQMIEKIGKTGWLVEFEGAWLSDKPMLVRSDIVENITPKDPVRQYGDFAVYVDSFKNRKLCMSCDVAEGVNKDSHCVQVIDVDSLEQVGEFANNTINQNLYFKEILKIIHLVFSEGCSDVWLSVEKNGLGNGILRLIENSNDDYLSNCMVLGDLDVSGNPKGTIGITTTNKSKLEGCATLKEMVEEGKLTLRSQSLLNELRMFVHQGNTFKAEKGAKDDRVMAMVIAMNMLKQIANAEEGVFDVLNEVSLDKEDEIYDIYF